MVPYAKRVQRVLAGSLIEAMRSGARRVVLRSSEAGPVGPHITRYSMYRRLGVMGEGLHLQNESSTRVVAISRSEPLCEILGLSQASITSADFPSFDLRCLPYPDGSFDVLVADQVLEHVEADPSVSIRESFRVVRPGGLVVHTTCFVNPIHEAVDLFRFTPSALAFLFARHGDVVELGGWGNRMVWVVEALGLRFQPVPHNPRHILHRLATYDEPAWPVVTWVIARKR
jgi:SAM-dependent methyltransferase